MSPNLYSPKISIGMPVFNGEKYIQKALDTLLAQTFTDFELIISDNASTDGTEKICHEYALKDSRIQYIRQNNNNGALHNFKYVFDKARGEYFSWAAADDWRSNDFFEKNYEFLESNPKYVASTSSNCFENQDIKLIKVNFSLNGNKFERLQKFFTHCWESHAIFYSLIRRSILVKCPYLNTESYLAKDWSINAFLLSSGKIARINDGYIIFGVDGASTRPNFIKSQQHMAIEALFPLWKFSLDVISLSRPMSWKEQMAVFSSLLKLNMDAFEKRYFLKKRASAFADKLRRK